MMNSALYNPGFKTIASKTVQSKLFIEGALRDVKILKAKITVKYGSDAAEKLQYFTPRQNVTDEEYDLSYLCVANAAMEIDTVVGRDMPALMKGFRKNSGPEWSPP